MSWNSVRGIGLWGLALWLLIVGSQVEAADWPMWRCDAARSAVSTEQLPTDLKLVWTREFSPRQQAWDDTLNLDLMTYDRVFEPVVMNGRLFLGFNDRDKLVAYDVQTGAELWTSFASGPVRLPPVAWKDRVFFASDDGYLYCVQASDGTLIWKFRGGPNSRQVLGNQRLVSAWPMRGGPVVRDGKIYVAASIWPFMGTFIYALDAETGSVVWVNDETGAQYIKQPHSAPSFAGVAPQGALVATNDVLLVPGGRSVPAAFDRQTGKSLYFEINAGGKGTGGSFVAANEESWFVHTRQKGTREFNLKTGVKTAFTPNEPVLAGDRIYAAHVEKGRAAIRAYDTPSKQVLWDLPIDAQGDLILAGNVLYAAGMVTTPNGKNVKSLVSSIPLPAIGDKPASNWQTEVPGTVERLIAANGKLVAVTLEGHVHAFGASAPQAPIVHQEVSASLIQSPEATPIAEQLLQAGAAEGYSLWIGAAAESLVTAVAARSPFLEFTIVDQDLDRADRLRKQFDAAGLYGRVSVHQSSLSELLPPSYLANELFIGAELTPALVKDRAQLARIYESVRPYGGILYLLTNPNDISLAAAQLSDYKLEQAKIETTEFGVVVRREGPLPGAGQWTHQHGDIANTIKSNDQRVKLPLGVLWFGGVSNEDILPRHGHGPPEQVVGGRLFIQGINSLTARDVYTGRLLWKRDFKDLGTYDVYYDDTYKETPLDTAYNQVHIPGANARGTNYVVTADLVYIIEGAVCLALDSATGKTVKEIALPQQDPAQPNEWGYIGIYEDVLIGGVGFAKYRTRHELVKEGIDAGLSPKRAAFGSKSLDRAASMSLIGFDRHTGKQLWKVDSLHSFWHNGIVAGNGLVYALDKNPQPVEEFLRRRGKSNPATYRLLAFDARTGQQAWELPGQVFGTWLGYSEKHDLLLQAGASGSDRLSSEVGQGMAVYQGKTGTQVWYKKDLKYAGPCILHNDLIITNANSYSESAGAYRITDGVQKLVEHPLTGALQPWKITRTYGCNSICASENLLTFRSGAAGFYDLLSEAGTGNFGGFKSGCTSNLIVADGVLNAPDYTRTCSCAYQNQTSLALVHMPDIEVWTNDNLATLDPSVGRVRRLGINLGAPGDRRDAQGLMWLEYPAVSGDAPDLGLEFTGAPTFYQDHPTTMTRAEIPWVVSSGVEGLKGLRLSLKALPPKRSLRQGILIERAEDDARESANGAMDLDSSTLELGQNADVKQLIGFRFTGINLSRGTEIRSAYLQLTSRTPSNVPSELVIRAEALGNAARFTEKSQNLSSRSLTQSEVRWSPASWEKAGDSGVAQCTPDLAPLIQEVVNREDWRPGNSIAFLISGLGDRVVTAYRGKESTPAKLIVDADETVPDAGTPAPSQPYRVRLHFGVPRHSNSEQREFDVMIEGQSIGESVKLGGKGETSTVRTVDRMLLGDWMNITLTEKLGRTVLSGIELQRLND